MNTLKELWPYKFFSTKFASPKKDTNNQYSYTEVRQPQSSQMVTGVSRERSASLRRTVPSNYGTSQQHEYEHPEASPPAKQELSTHALSCRSCSQPIAEYLSLDHHCSQGGAICNACLRGYIKEQSRGASGRDIHCPACDSKLHSSSVVADDLQEEVSLHSRFRSLDISGNEDQNVDFGDSWGECEICFESLSTDDITLSQTLPCQKHTYCRECLKSHLKSCLEYNKERQCPDRECHTVFLDGDIDTITGSDVLRLRFYQKEMERALLHSEDLCQCPAPDCGKIWVRPVMEEAPVIIEVCPACFHNMVFVRQDGKQYGQIATEQTAEEYETYLYIKDREKAGLIKPCPRCKLPIEKKEGSCPHTVCPCDYEFCYVCMNDWGGFIEGYSTHTRCDMETGKTPLKKKDVQLPEFQPVNIP
ncbi:IBR domain-containing protein [Parendozoicomonas haliclonae]|uniref:RBR-type E3 ubiquitin transferase n=1 Tax=Parendozoicomonas haliclonae TaxID=1960125 RepID=A0A1X7AIQ6_9GAMM|nr:IBR domain-containing protein [Parendozoicomonas haliclonae]SMA45356.1 IBR domain protein [Parendozoicomonas haliclonae]